MSDGERSSSFRPSSGTQKYTATPKYPAVHIGIEVAVARFDPDVPNDLDGVVAIEGDGFTPFHTRNEIDTNCFSPVERLLAASVDSSRASWS
jgi:hypothetical protein